MEVPPLGKPPRTDVLIPTLKTEEEIAPLARDIGCAAGVPVRVFASCTKASASVNRNLCLEQAVSPVVLMLDDDITGLPVGWARRMLDVMWLHPDCVMCSPRLINQDGSPGIMVGNPHPHGQGCEVLRLRELPTACIAIRNDGTRFDEQYRGSGFEDNDYCRQLRDTYPAAQFICIHDLQVIHRNEAKNQRGENWKHNEAYYKQKWGL